MSMITCPEFTNLDREIIFDFTSCLQENIEEIEFCIHKLDSSEDPELVHELFRAMHSLKGNCRMVLLLPFVYITHELEEVVSEMRDETRHYHHLYGSIFISVITIIESMTRQLIEQGECRGDVLENLDTMVKKVRNAKATPANEDLEVAEEALSELIKLQELPKQMEPSESVAASSTSIESNQKPKNSKLKQTNNLAFFSQLAVQLDCLSIYRQGRTKNLIELCLAVNQQLKKPVDQEQLTAAVYIHDIGMAFVPSAILNKQDSLSKEEIAMIRRHIATGTSLLANIEGWQEAALMVAQHHERYDGTGYPKGLQSNDIHPGAILLALADTYCAITHERSDRSYKRSLFSAVTLINGESGRQFDPEFVDIFNATIRKLFIRPE